MRKLRSLLAALASAVLLVAGLPATAAAQTTELPVIHSALSDLAGDRGTLLVTVTAPHGVDTLRAEVVLFGSGEVVATDEFVLRSGTPQDGVWASAQPFLLDELDLHDVHVEVTDSAGNFVRRERAGFLDYRVVATFHDLVIEPRIVTFEQRDVTVTGVLTGRWPGTGEIRPLAGELLFPTFGSGDFITGPDGGFQGTVTMSSHHTSIAVLFIGDFGFVPAISESVEIEAVLRPTRVKIRANPQRVDRGETVRVSGQLKWLTSDGWEPVPDARVFIEFCHASGCPDGRTRFTDAEGRFELLAEPSETGRYEVRYSRFGEFQEPATDAAEVIVRQPAAVSDFRAARTAAGVVRLEGHLQFGGLSPEVVPVQLQFSRRGNAGWERVSTVTAEPDDLGGHFVAELDWPTSGYWRARYPGVRDQFQSAVSPVIRVD